MLLKNSTLYFLPYENATIMIITDRKALVDIKYNPGGVALSEDGTRYTIIVPVLLSGSNNFAVSTTYCKVVRINFSSFFRKRKMLEFLLQYDLDKLALKSKTPGYLRTFIWGIDCCYLFIEEGVVVTVFPGMIINVGEGSRGNEYRSIRFATKAIALHSEASGNTVLLENGSQYTILVNTVCKTVSYTSSPSCYTTKDFLVRSESSNRVPIDFDDSD